MKGFWFSNKTMVSPLRGGETLKIGFNQVDKDQNTTVKDDEGKQSFRVLNCETQ